MNAPRSLRTRPKPKMALTDRRRRQAEIAEWAVAHPDSKLREIAVARVRMHDES